MYVLTNTSKEFIPTSQKDQDAPLTFICKPPTRKTVLDLQEKLIQSVSEDGELESMDLPIANMMELYLDSCVVDWKNMNDEQGNPIIFSKEVFEGFNDMEILLELYTFCKELAEGNVQN